VITLKKKDLLKYYGGAYLLVAILETLLFTAIHGDWSFRSIILSFSIWGIIWLISMFAYPSLITDANYEMLALSPYLSLLGYVIIILVFYIVFRVHKQKVEKKLGKKLTFGKLMDLYFPIKEET